MDNKGGLSSVLGENGAILTPPENAPAAEPGNFEDFLNSESLEGNAEMALQTPEMDGEMGELAPGEQPEARPIAAPIIIDEEAGEDADVEADFKLLEEIDIPRETEEIPKKYVDQLAKGVKKYKGDPNKLCSFMDKARWDFMRKDFNRDKGQGLNGSAANGD